MSTGKYTDREKLMLKLSFIAYASLFGSDAMIQEAIEKALAKITPKQNLVWGPAIGHKKPESPKRPNYALIYIVRNSGKTNEYTVVVRGTNPFSLITWLEQDLNVRHKVLWTRESPFSPAKDARISAAANKSLKIHKNLRYPDKASDGKTFYEFLEEKIILGAPLTINFTGHSLGGLTAAILALWFYDMLGTKELIAFREQTGINVYSFAGPTAGDMNFTTYADHILHPPSSLRCCTSYINEADIAINMWHRDDMEKICGFYGKAVPISAFLNKVLRFLIGMVNDLAYMQLTNKKIVAEFKEVTEIEGLHDIDLISELGLKDLFPINAFYKKRPLNIGINEEEIAEDINKSLTWLLVAVYQHVIPYIFNILSDKREIDLILDEIIFPLIEDTYPGAKIKETLKKSLRLPV